MIEASCVRSLERYNRQQSLHNVKSVELKFIFFTSYIRHYAKIRKVKDNGRAEVEESSTEYIFKKLDDSYIKAEYNEIGRKRFNSKQQFRF